MLDFIAGHAICRRDRNAAALIRAVAFWAVGTSAGSAAGGQSDRQLGQRLSSRHALVQVKSVCSRYASEGCSLPRLTMFGGLPQHIDARQVAVFIALRAESVDT
jgi:hypothetical protein